METLSKNFEVEKHRTIKLKKRLKITEACPNTTQAKVVSQWDQQKWQMIKP